jgi:hypothetical protein
LLHLETVGADDTLWTGGPGNYTNPKAPAVLSNVRSLVDKGQYAEATAVAYDLSGEQTQVHILFFMLIEELCCYIIIQTLLML